MHSFTRLNGSQGLNEAGGGLFIDNIDQFMFLQENHLNWAGEIYLESISCWQ